MDNQRYFSVDAPIVATLPHFYNAHRAYGLMVNGLDPDEEKHNIFTDIEPTTGTPLRAGQRMQFNMYLRRVSQISKIKFQMKSSGKLSKLKKLYFKLQLSPITSWFHA